MTPPTEEPVGHGSGAGRSRILFDQYPRLGTGWPVTGRWRKTRLPDLGQHSRSVIQTSQRSRPNPAGAREISLFHARRKDAIGLTLGSPATHVRIRSSGVVSDRFPASRAPVLLCPLFLSGPRDDDRRAPGEVPRPAAATNAADRLAPEVAATPLERDSVGFSQQREGFPWGSLPGITTIGSCHLQHRLDHCLEPRAVKTRTVDARADRLGPGRLFGGTWMHVINLIQWNGRWVYGLAAHGDLVLFFLATAAVIGMARFCCSHGGMAFFDRSNSGCA